MWVQSTRSTRAWGRHSLVGYAARVAGGGLDASDRLEASVPEVGRTAPPRWPGEALEPRDGAARCDGQISASAAQSRSWITTPRRRSWWTLRGRVAGVPQGPLRVSAAHESRLRAALALLLPGGTAAHARGRNARASTRAGRIVRC